MTLPCKIFALSAAIGLSLGSCSGAKQIKSHDSNSNHSVSMQEGPPGNETAPMSPVDEMAAIQHGTENAMGMGTGRDISDTWARKMIVHQKGVIRLADLLLKTSTQPEFRSVAASTIDHARKNLRALGSATETSVFHGERFSQQFAGPQFDMFDAMTKASGKTFEATWAAKMTAFEHGAVSLAGVAVNQGDEGGAEELARQIAAQQANDAESMAKYAEIRDWRRHVAAGRN